MGNLRVIALSAISLLLLVVVAIFLYIQVQVARVSEAGGEAATPTQADDPKRWAACDAMLRAMRDKAGDDKVHLAAADEYLRKCGRPR